MSDDSSTEDDDGTYEITAAELTERGESSLRHMLAQHLGNQIGGDSNLYETFNWTKDPSVEQYYAAYLRNPYARAVTDIPVNTTWRKPPEISDDGETDGDGTDTPFEEEVAEIADELRAWHYAKRGDKLAGIGEYGLVVLEFDDISTPADFQNPVTNPNELTGMRPFSQASLDEIVLGGPSSGRWGEPEQYNIDLTDENDDVETQGPDELWVHHSRVLHIPSDELLDDEIRGTPRMEPVYNNLCDIEQTLGSAGELAYRASAWGLNVNISPDYSFNDDGESQQEHLERWYYGLDPILRTQGADDVQSLGGENIDPGPVINPNVEAISAQKGIPQSVLKGNETGERATSEDLKEWYGKIGERREEFVTPVIVRELIDRLLDLGILTPPTGDSYTVDWPPLAETSEEDVANIHHRRAEVLETSPELEQAMDVNQQLEYIKDGSLPDEFDEPEEIEPEPPDPPELPEQFGDGSDMNDQLPDIELVELDDDEQRQEQEQEAD